MTTPTEVTKQFAAMADALAVAPSSKRRRHTVLPCESHWLEIECFRDDGRPMAGLAFVLRAAGGTVLHQGLLDHNGWARFVRIAGTADCTVEFVEVPEGASAQPIYQEFWPDVVAIDKHADAGG